MIHFLPKATTRIARIRWFLCTVLCIIGTMLYSCNQPEVQSPPAPRLICVALDNSLSFKAKPAAMIRIAQIVESLEPSDHLTFILIVEDSLAASSDAIHATMPKPRYALDSSAKEQLARRKQRLIDQIRQAVETGSSARKTDIFGAITAASSLFEVIDPNGNAWEKRLIIFTDGEDDLGNGLRVSLRGVKVSMLYVIDNPPTQQMQAVTHNSREYGNHADFWGDYLRHCGAVDVFIPPAIAINLETWW